MPKAGFPASVQSAIRDKLSIHSMYRKHVKPLPGGPSPCLSWKRGWKSSAELFLQIVESVAFDQDYDPSLKNGVKNGKSAEEMAEYAQFKEKLAEVTECLMKEKAAEPQPATATGDATTTPAAGAANLAVAEEAASKEEEKQAFQKQWRSYAARLVDSHCTLISEPTTETQLTKILRGHAMASSFGSKGSDFVAAIFTTGLSSESITDPHIRGAPFKKERLMKLGKAFLKSRQPEESEDLSTPLLPGDLFIALDNQKPGLHAKFTDFMKTATGKKDHLVVKKFTLVYDFDSVVARRHRVKGIGTINQTETMMLVGKGALNIPSKQHKHYHGHNTGTVIAPIKLPPFAKAWCLTFEKKKAAYGNLRLQVGGRTDDGGEDDLEDDDDAMLDGSEVPPTVEDFVEGGETTATPNSKKPKTRAPGNIEPMSYYSIPCEFFDNLQETFNIKDVYDFTPGDGEAALAFLKARKGYIGICFNDSHVELLRERLIDNVMTAFGTAKDPLFHAAFAAGSSLHGAGNPELAPPPTTTTTRTPNPKRSRRDDSDGEEKKDEKKKRKRNKKKKSSSSSSSSDSGTTG